MGVSSCEGFCRGGAEMIISEKRHGCFTLERVVVCHLHIQLSFTTSLLGKSLIQPVQAEDFES